MQSGPRHGVKGFLEIPPQKNVAIEEVTQKRGCRDFSKLPHRPFADRVKEAGCE